MQFLTAPQIKVIAAFRSKDVDYIVLERAFNEPGTAVVTFWLHDGNWLTMRIDPKGDMKSA
jgi:hypothetical protein